MNKSVPVAVVVVLLLAAAFLILSPSGGAQGKLVALQITDPAQVPVGTQALVITYSSLAAHLSNAGSSSGWVSSSGSGSVNLLAVLNLKQTLGAVSVPANASINMVRFVVNSASITVNGTTHNVTVPSGMVTAHIIGRTTVNGNASVLIDLSPVVASIITNTTTVFVLVPSVRAVVIGGGSNSTTLQAGVKVALTENDTADLEENEPNVSVTAASLSVSSGNVTHFSITLRDNSNTSVVVEHVGFRGRLNVQFNSSSLQAYANAFIANITSRLRNSTFCAAAGGTVQGGLNASVISHFNNLTPAQQAQLQSYLAHTSLGSHIPNFNITVGEGERIQINASICTQAGLAALTSRMQSMAQNFSAELENDQGNRQIMIFDVGSNGALSVPLGTADFENPSSNYTLQAGQTATLSFNGAISFGHGMFKISPIAGATYQTGAQIEDIGIVFKNVTATSS